MISKYSYYLRSIVTLLTQFEEPAKILAIFSGRHKAYPTKISLRNSSLSYWVRSPMDVWIIKETCVDRDYFRTGITPSSNWNMIDIGAGLGDFSVFAAQLAHAGELHAYEPLETSIRLLERNIDENQVNNVVTYPTAVTSQGQTLAAKSLDIAPTSTEFVAADAAASAGEGTVESVSLTQVIGRLPNQRCDFLKIDCEGGEFDILLNSPSNTLARIDRIALEYHNSDAHSHTDIVNRLKQEGYTVTVEGNPVHTFLGFIYAERV